PDQVLGAYAAFVAPAVLSADSPRFLGFIPAAPTKAALLFDMLVSCASIQGISWLEAAGAIAAENQVLALIAARAGLPAFAGRAVRGGGQGRGVAPSRAAGPRPCLLSPWRARWPSAAGRPATARGGGRWSVLMRIRRCRTRSACLRWTRWSSAPKVTYSPDVR